MMTGKITLELAEIDALEKATRNDATILQPLRADILALAGSRSKEIRWHVAQLLPRLTLRDKAQRRMRADILKRWFDEDSSRIVRVNALQALCDLARTEPRLCAETARRLSAALSDPSAAVRARARKLAGAYLVRRLSSI
jgi:hypothetical protein